MINLLGGIAPPPSPTWEDIQPQIAFYIGNLKITWYAIFIMFGFALAIFLTCMKLWKRYGVSVEPFYWFILIGVPFGILGANFGSCVLGEPAGKPWSEFWSSFGTGLAIEWGVFFDTIAAAIYFPLVLNSKKYWVRDEFGPKPAVRKVSAWLYVDALAPTVLIAQFMGRWGNYFNQEVYGAIVTNEKLSWFLHDCLPWMWVNTTPSGAIIQNYCQPLFLWEGLANIVGCAILYVGLEFIKQRKAGDMAASYFVWYGTLRLCLEPLRDPTYKSTASIAFSAVWVALGVVVIILNHTLLFKWRKYRVLYSLSHLKTHRLVQIDFLTKEAKSSNSEEAIKAQSRLDEMLQTNRPLLRNEQQMLFYDRW